jgi:uncharacterized protein YuzE
MKLIYDRETDTLTLRLREGDYRESDEVRPGLICDYDQKKRLLAIEILYASRQAVDLESLGIELAGKPVHAG